MSGSRIGPSVLDADLDNELREAFWQLELPLLLIGLENLTVHAASKVAADRLGVDSATIVGRPVTELLAQPDEHTTLALELLRRGVVHFYRSDPAEDAARDASESCVTAQAVELDGHQFAMLQLTARTHAAETPLGRYLGREPSRMVIGTADTSLTVTSVSNDTCDVLDLPPEHIVGQRLLAAHVNDVPTLLTADANRGDASAALRLRLRNREGACRC